MKFQWDEAKRAGNIEKHGIDFQDAISIFENPVWRKRSDRKGEERYQATGNLNGIGITIVYVIRDNHYRIISARKARRNEQRSLDLHVSGGSDKT